MSLVLESKIELRKYFSPNCSELLLWYIIDENELHLRRFNYMKSIYETILLDMEENIKFFLRLEKEDIGSLESTSDAWMTLGINMITIVSLLFQPELTLTRWNIKKSEDGYQVIEAMCNSKCSYFYWLLDKMIISIERLLPVTCLYLLEQKDLYPFKRVSSVNGDYVPLSHDRVSSSINDDFIKFLKILFKRKEITA